MLSLGANLLTSWSDGPPILDIQKNYLFSASLFKTDWNTTDLTTNPTTNPITGVTQAVNSLTQYRYLNPLLMAPNLVYISGLIQKISQPQQGIITKDIELGPLTIQIPKSVSMESFTITFVEEIMVSVEYFWRNWFLEMTGGNSLTFSEIQNLCLSLLFTRDATGILPSLIPGQGAASPVNAYFYPNVLPISYEIDEWDKGGEGYVASTITFIRVPKIPNLSGPSVGIQDLMAKLTNGIHS